MKREDRARAFISSAALLLLASMALSCSSGMSVNQNVTSLLISTNALGVNSARTLTLTQGQPRQIFATAMYADGSSKNVTVNTFWLSSDPTCAGIGQDTGLISAAPTVPQACLTSVTASFGLLTSNTTVTVTPGILQTINLTSSSETPSAGGKLTFIAMGTYGGLGQPQDITDLVTWHNDNPSVLTLDPGSGNATVASVPGQVAHVYASFIGINSQSLRITVQ